MPQSMPSPLALAAGLLLWAFFGTATAQQSSEESDGVSRDLLQRESGLADLQKCPAEIVAKKENRDYLTSDDCKPGKFASCASRCTAGDAGACYWLGYELQQAHGLPRASELLYQRSCKLGVMSGCTNRAAGMLDDRPDDSKVQACAVATFAKTCSFDDPWGCNMYALQLSRGIGVAQNRELALRVLEKSCQYGAEDPACSSGMQLRREILGKRPAGKQNEQ